MFKPQENYTSSSTKSDLMRLITPQLCTRSLRTFTTPAYSQLRRFTDTAAKMATRACYDLSACERGYGADILGRQKLHLRLISRLKTHTSKRAPVSIFQTRNAQSLAPSWTSSLVARRCRNLPSGVTTRPLQTTSLLLRAASATQHSGTGYSRRLAKLIG